ncbi:MAG: hypothetical protein JO080_08440 [Mucilaginibacter sp.]|nr:hypothetical protein [Mucilaginibacter sp.]
MENVAFSDLVRDIIHTSGKLAAQFGYEYVDSEHLLLAIIDESLKDPKAGGVVLKTFKQLGIDIFQLIESIETTFDPNQTSIIIEKIPLTHKAEFMLKMSVLEARSLQKFHIIEAEHILLSYLKVGSDFSKNELTGKFNLTYDRVKDFIIKLD